MNDIAKNLKFCFDISKFKSMSQFCKVIGIGQANLSKKMSESNTKYSFNKNDIQKICYNLGLRKEWLVNSDGDMFDDKAAVSPSDWVFGKDRTPNINMVNEENAHHNKQIIGDFSESEINLLRDAEFHTNPQRESRDLFMLCFYLIGINISDLLDLKPTERLLITLTKI